MKTEQSRKAVAGPDILAFSEKPDALVDLTGWGPRVRFTLDDGTEIDVEHNGDHLVVHNLGSGRSSLLSLTASSVNTFLVRGVEP